MGMMPSHAVCCSYRLRFRSCPLPLDNISSLPFPSLLHLAILLGDRSKHFSPGFNSSMLSLLGDLRFVIAVSSVTGVIIHSLKCTKALRGCKTRLRINHAFPDVPFGRRFPNLICIGPIASACASTRTHTFSRSVSVGRRSGKMVFAQLSPSSSLSSNRSLSSSNVRRRKCMLT